MDVIGGWNEWDSVFDTVLCVGLTDLIKLLLSVLKSVCKQMFLELVVDLCSSFISSSLLLQSITLYMSPSSSSALSLLWSFRTIWTTLLFDVLSLFFHLFGCDVIQWCRGWSTGSFELWFYFQLSIQGIFSSVRLNVWRNMYHLWCRSPMLKKLRD